MNLSALHTIIRATVRDGEALETRPDAPIEARLSPAERAALAIWRRRRRRAGATRDRLMPVTGSLEWWAPPNRAAAQ